MAPRLQWLSSCKASQLRSLAVATGINSSGTKSVLISQLSDSLLDQKFPTPLKKDGLRILSIDMGIRNLAYCQIRLPKSSPSASNESSIVTAWDRVAVSSKVTDNLALPAVKEAFDPATFAQHAYALIKKLVLSPSATPDHVLIERQRFRSMGGSAVLEWTLRVNMFEAMLYATLKTLREEGKWGGRVFPVIPSKVGQFWLGNEKVEKETEKGEKGGKSRKKNIKGEKIQVVDEMLKARATFGLEAQAKEMAERWRGKMEGRRTKGTKEEEKMGKLDDLADCLLQGLAWVGWEENRKTILERGVDALDDL